MSYARVTILTGTTITDEAIADYDKNYLPAAKERGATSATVIQVGPDSLVYMVTYPDKETADAAAEWAKGMRAKASADYKASTTVHEGEVLLTMTQPKNKVGTGGVDGGPTMPSGVVG